MFTGMHTCVCVLKKLERWTNNHSHPANRSRPLPDFGEAAMSARCSARVVPACACTSSYPPSPSRFPQFTVYMLCTKPGRFTAAVCDLHTTATQTREGRVEGSRGRWRDLSWAPRGTRPKILVFTPLRVCSSCLAAICMRGL